MIYKKLVNYFIMIFFAIMVGAILVLVAGANPIEAFSAFFWGVFGSKNGIAEVFVKATPLTLAGLGIAVAFNTSFINIGAEGQLYIGALAGTAIAIFFPGMPFIIHFPLMIICAFIAGGIWAAIPGLLKARYGISEVINTIMFNYIAINIVGIMIRGPLRDPEGYLPQSPQLPSSCILPALLPPTRLHLGYILAILLAIALYIILLKTTVGYEMRVVGLNKRAAECLGIPVIKNLILSAFISGGMAGLAGIIEIAGLHRRLLDGISPGYGYTAIVVALLGKNHPLGVILAAISFAVLQVGANSMQRKLGIPVSITWIFIGLTVLLVLAEELFDFWKRREGLLRNDRGAKINA